MSHSNPVTHDWKAFEHKGPTKSKKFYIGVTLILFVIIVYALLTNNAIMAITFILIGITGYLNLSRDPVETRFMVTDEGVIAGKELYEYDSIRSFWIFYEPEADTKHISLHTDAEIMPFVRIPLGDENPVEMRNTLLEFIPEEKHEEQLIDTLEKFF